MHTLAYRRLIVPVAGDAQQCSRGGAAIDTAIGHVALAEQDLQIGRWCRASRRAHEILVSYVTDPTLFDPQLMTAL